MVQKTRYKITGYGRSGSVERVTSADTGSDAFRQARRMSNQGLKVRIMQLRRLGRWKLQKKI